MFKLSEKRMSTSFRSYVGFTDNDQKSTGTTDDDDTLDESVETYLLADKLNPRLLGGEVVVAEAQNVLMYAPISARHGQSGILNVTNFKLSFVTTDEVSQEENCHQRNLLLCEFDVALSNVDEVYQVVGDKRRRLLPGSNVPDKVKGLCVVCKNMRVVSFSFKFSPAGHGKTATNALLHHAFPSRHNLLFGYEIKLPISTTPSQVIPSFRAADDWALELARCGCAGWRLSNVNRDFNMCTSLPECVVVPASLVDCQIVEAARHFRLSRPPVWVWGSLRGASLVRMADILPSITERVQENIMLENVRRSHPKHTPPLLLEISQDLPTPRDIQASFLKLRELCCPDSARTFWLQDGHFLSSLESSRWLQTVSSCLQKAIEAASALADGQSVVLQEPDGRDLTCIISTLTQMLLDRHCRSIAGFQGLLQKEWIALGHPCCSRLGHVPNPEVPQSPLLLLLLDCVWQMLRQAPTAFEFTETYLTTLWDSVHIAVFDTFLFDCERDRYRASTPSFNNDKESQPDPVLRLRSLWDWSVQFSSRDIALFYNPLFADRPASLDIRPGVSALSVWAQCYFRWIPLLDIAGGGPPQIDLGIRELCDGIAELRRRIAAAAPAPASASASAGDCDKAGTVTLTFAPSSRRVSSFFPFGRRYLVGGDMGAGADALIGEVTNDSREEKLLLHMPD